MDLNRRGLQQKYSSIADFVRTSARTGEGLTELKAAIAKIVAGMDHVDTPFPQSWFQVKERLATMHESHDYIPYRLYQELCCEEGVIDDVAQRTLVRFLHDLGLALNFQDDDRVRDTGVLNPEWVTQGVYALLNAPQLAQAGGVLHRRQLSQLLDPARYPLERQRLVLDLMAKFELAIPFESGDRYLIPDLLPVEQPLFDWNDTDTLQFEYHYAVLPYSILHRFMVRQHSRIHQDIIWRTGVMLTYEGMQALIKADVEAKVMSIAIGGDGNRREFLAMLRFTFDSLHANITGTKPEEHVPIPDHPGVTVPFKHLLKLERSGYKEHFPPGLDKPINVLELLGTVESRHPSYTRQALYQLLQEGFNNEEFRELLLEVDVDEIKLAGESTSERMRELVTHMERHGRIPELVEAMRGMRPELFAGRRR